METLDIIKLFENSDYSFKKYHIGLPKRDGTLEEIKNIWLDVKGNIYEYINNMLLINIRNFDYSLISVIDKIPNNIGLNFKISSVDGTAYINELIEVLSKCDRDNIVLTLHMCKFASNSYINIDSLQNDIKLSNHNGGLPSCDDLEWYSLNLDDESFDKLINKLESNTKKRILLMRGIAKEFSSVLQEDNIQSIDGKVKAAFDWCKRNIIYATEATNSDGTLANDGSWAQDPIQTFIKKRGVCEGRAKLLKILLNNYYTKVKCYTVDGITITNLEHQWNEYVRHDGVIVQMDLSGQTPREENHNDYEINEGEYKQRQRVLLSDIFKPPGLPSKDKIVPPPLPKRK